MQDTTTTRRRLTLRLAALSIVVFAVGLAAVSIVLSIQQARSLHLRLLTQAQSRANDFAGEVRSRFDRTLRHAFGEFSGILQVDNRDDWVPPTLLPRWIDGIHAWSPPTLTPLLSADDAPAGYEALLRARLIAVDQASRESSHVFRAELLYDRLGDRPIVIACAKAPGAGAVIALRIHLKRLRSELLEPGLASYGGLELTAASASTGPWSKTLSGPLRFWAVRPNEDAIRDEENLILGQTFVHLGLTVLALSTLLAGTWYFGRLVRKEVALAELKANFVADVSHELKTPLALIHLFGETLQSGRVASEEKRQEYYDIITRESRRLTNLIDNILNFARIEAGRQEYTFEPTDIGEVVRDIYDTYRAVLDHSQFTHALKIDDKLPAVDADRNAIAQVVLNLMSNAVKYAGDQRELQIQVSRDTRRNREGVLLCVNDRGIGIRPEDRAYLFEGFFRADDGRVQQQGGTGLGLALVKHIVDAHGGSIDAEPRLVKGTTFQVFLPAGVPQTAQREPDSNGDDAATSPGT